MKRRTRATAMALFAEALAGYSGLNGVLARQREPVVMHHIFDITRAEAPGVTFKATTSGFAQNAYALRQNRPSMLDSGIPPTPSRFQLVDISNLPSDGVGAVVQLASMQAGGIRVCDG